MRSFRVLDSLNPQDYVDWVSVWESWPEREVSAHPEYVRLFSRPKDHTCCAVLQEARGNVLFPFILRPLDIEEWGMANVWDIVTPYGYGGAFMWGEVNGDVFWGRFDEWAKQSRVVSSFVRLSLFEDQMIPFSGEVEIKSQNVIRTLDLDSGAMWMDYAHKVRKNVKKARGNGLEVQVDLDGSRLQEFLEVYYSTMRRRKAASQYYFPKDFFQRIVRGLAGQYAFFYTIYEEKLISAELVLISARYLYSLLGGTLAEAYSLRPNDLLKHAIIEWGRRQGKRAFVLGGGYEDGDGIFRYKRSFAPNGVFPFKVGKRIYDSQSYERLIEGRLEWERNQGRQWKPNAAFFPAYRG